VSETELQPAPRWRRGLAGLVDAAVLAAISALGIVAAVRRRRESGIAPSSPGRLVAAATLAVVALRERGDSPGLRLLRLERRDRVTGRRPGSLRAIAVIAVSQVPRILAARATQAARARGEKPSAGAIEAHRVALRKLRDEHAGDPDAFRRAVRELPPATVVSWRILGVHLLVSALARRALAPLRRRAVGDTITVVIG
jgi:hypothetical protein